VIVFPEATYSAIIFIIIICFTALGGRWPPQANVASDLYLAHPPANFYNLVSLLLTLPRQSIFDFGQSRLR
jgi:hypothetical protein